jgi:hypothetical protein
MNKIINFEKKYDFGHDFYVQILNIGNRSLIQLSLSWNDYPSWPYVQITLGSGKLLGGMFWVYKLGFDVDFFSYTWNLKYLKDEDEETVDSLGSGT